MSGRPVVAIVVLTVISSSGHALENWKTEIRRFAPNGTVAVIRVYESTLKLVALTPPKVTVVAPVKLSPLMMTLVSTGPLVGEKLAIVGITRKGTSLKSIPPGVVTLTLPVVAPAGTIVVISVFETILNVFAVV